MIFERDTIKHVSSAHQYMNAMGDEKAKQYPSKKTRRLAHSKTKDSYPGYFVPNYFRPKSSMAVVTMSKVTTSTAQQINSGDESHSDGALRVFTWVSAPKFRALADVYFHASALKICMPDHIQPDPDQQECDHRVKIQEKRGKLGGLKDLPCEGRLACPNDLET